MHDEIPWASILGLLLAGLLALMFLSEWYKIGITADPEVIASYHFGSDPMVGYGGPSYESADAYARSALIEGLGALAIVGVFIVALWRRSRSVMLGAYVLLVVGLILNYTVF